MKIKEIESKTIIVASKLPDTDYVVNPYTGCQFGCLYCYASFMGRFVQESRANWGNYVYVKINAVELAEKELSKWSMEKRQATVLLSSVTDPYHGIEKKYRLTRGILKAFADENYPGRLSILTKSPMVIRDIDLFQEIPNIDVGMTITTTDDRLSRCLEVTAPLASRRLDTLKQLNKKNIPTYVFIGPLLPHFSYEPKLLDELFKRIADTGVKEVYVEHINLPSYVKERLWKELRQEPEAIQKIYESSQTKEYREVLTQMVDKLLVKYNLHIRLGGTIYHQDSTNPSVNNDTDKKENFGDIQQLMHDAITNGATIRIGYQDFHGNVTERVIAPFEWSDFDQQKVHAYCYLRQDNRNFSISKMLYAEYVGLASDYMKQ